MAGDSVSVGVFLKSLPLVVTRWHVEDNYEKRFHVWRCIAGLLLEILPSLSRSDLGDSNGGIVG